MTVYKQLLSLPENFSFRINLDYLKSTEDGLFRTDQESITRFIVLDGNLFFIKIYVSNNNRLVIETEDVSQSYTKQFERQIMLYIRDWFDLDIHLEPFYIIAKQDEYLKMPISKFYGLRNIGIPGIFEAFVWAILGQQINLSFASTLKDRFIKNYGKRLIHNGEDYWLFPSPRLIASLSMDELFKIGMSRRKCEYIRGIARLIANNQISREKLVQLSDINLAVKQLTAIKGIGPWTANYVLLRCVRYPNAFPINDVGLHNALKLAGSLDRKPSIDEIKQIASAWEGYESYATFFLWRLVY